LVDDCVNLLVNEILDATVLVQRRDNCEHRTEDEQGGTNTHWALATSCCLRMLHQLSDTTFAWNNYIVPEAGMRLRYHDLY